MTKHIPNFITLMNLFFGSLAIWATFNGQYYLVPGLFWAAILCDYADGMAARMLKVHSDMGKELDSLADMVGFGLLPGVIYFKLIAEVAGLPSNEINMALPLWPLPFLGFIITLFSALRLAKFNLDTRQTDGFLGLATPSSTAFAVGLLLIYQHDPSLSWLFNVPTLLGLCIGMSLLLVSELPMLGLKFKRYVARLAIRSALRPAGSVWRLRRHRSTSLEEAQQLAHIGNFEYQVDTQTFSFSDEGQKILEVSHPDVALDKLKQIILPSDRGLLDEWFNIVREKEFAKGDLRLLFDDNRLKFVFVQYKMVRQRNGKPFKVTGILQDITDRKLAEQEILENQERYQSIFTQSKDAIMFSNWLGDIIDCNDATLHLFGYTRDEIQDVKLVQLYKKPEERERLVSLLEEHGSVYDYEVEMLTKTGQIRNCLISVTKTQTLTFAGYQGIIRDITEKRQNETLIKAKELAERTAELKQQFLAKVSHEIRTPMNAILGMTHLMLKSNLDAEQVNTAQTIKQASENLLSIINDILEISQLQSGAIHFEDKAFSLKQVLKGIISMFEYKIKEKGLKFVFDYAIEDDLALIGDPIRLGQILINLINNSIKFTDKGFVALNVKILESLEDAFSLQFEIEDSGEGISAEKLEHVFDMFVQVSDDFNKVYGGTGLGLAIVKQLVDLQNGKIGLKSTKGVGTCFSIALTFKKMPTHTLSRMWSLTNNPCRCARSIYC
jgi:PAS domain S-box-containing protein